MVSFKVWIPRQRRQAFLACSQRASMLGPLSEMARNRGASVPAHSSVCAHGTRLPRNTSGTQTDRLCATISTECPSPLKKRHGAVHPLSECPRNPCVALGCEPGSRLPLVSRQTTEVGEMASDILHSLPKDNRRRDRCGPGLGTE